MFFPRYARLPLFALALGIFLAIPAARAGERTNWNADWSFTPSDSGQSEGADWRRVHLPHDWSIEQPRGKDEAAGGLGGYFRTGLGWYRKTFHAPNEWRHRCVTVLFEGIYRDATVTLNGQEIGRSVYGYLPLEVELTSHLRWDGDNVLEVRVDNSAQPNSRWYTGSGIYRPVWLDVRAPVHVVTDGVFVWTEKLTQSSADVGVRTRVQRPRSHEGRADADGDRLVVETRIEDATGREVAQARAEAVGTPEDVFDVESRLSIPEPQYWSPQTPVLYRAVTRLLRGTEELDRIATMFGVRTVRVSAEHGFELNGVPLELNGGNVHHDNGVLGAAAFDRAEERKAELLKRAGFNAVRTAHNPPSRAFLEACDRLGLLVVNEIFDGWAKAKTKQDYSVFFREGWKRDVDAWVARDRNHPSVVMWSVGNEMFERGNEGGRQIARELAGRVREQDPTRAVTAGVNGMGKNGDWTELDPLFATLDVAGYNYELAHHADDHARLPGRVIMAAESYQNEVFTNWLVAAEHAYVIGDFVWSGMDYLGEAGIGRVFAPDETMLKHWEGEMWPWFGAYCGDIDLTGWRKPVSHYRNVVWDRGEKIFMAVKVPAPGGAAWNLSPWALKPALPSWTWPGHEGTLLEVEVYSRCDAVRLELNGRSLGEKPTGGAQEFRARFQVPYEPGELAAVGLVNARESARHVLATADAPSRFRTAADRSRLKADGEDLAFITIEAVDERGRWNPNTVPPRVTVQVSGAATLAGFGTANMTADASYFETSQPLFQGRALVVVRTTRSAGEIDVAITADGFVGSRVTLHSERVGGSDVGGKR